MMLLRTDLKQNEDILLDTNELYFEGWIPMISGKLDINIYFL